MASLAHSDVCWHAYAIYGEWLPMEWLVLEPPVIDNSVLPAFGSTLIHVNGNAASKARKKRTIVRRVI